MKYDIDHVGHCADCGVSLSRGDRWNRTVEGNVTRYFVLRCRPCFLKAHPESAAHGPEFTHPEDKR